MTAPACHKRPAEPDSRILDRAADAAVELAGWRGSPVQWTVDERIDRPQSTLFPLRLVSDDKIVMRAYYKVHRLRERTPPAKARRKYETTRRVLERGPGLSSQFLQLAANVPAAMPAILAVDTDSLTEIQVALPGAPMRRPLAHALLRRRRRAIRLYRVLGTALALLERCEDATLYETEPWCPDIQSATRRIDTVLTGNDLRRLEGLLKDLLDEVRHDGSRCYSHGDMSREHVLFTHTQVGLIDPLWAIRWSGYDVAHQAWWLRQELPRLPSWTARLTAALLSGYGEPALPATPEWRLTQLWLDTNLAGREPRHRIGQLRRRQAADNLLAALPPSIW